MRRSDKPAIGQPRSVKAIHRRNRGLRAIRYMLMISFCICAVVITIAVMSGTSFFSFLKFRSGDDIRSVSSVEVPVGRIVVQTDTEQCELMTFNNDTGHTTTSAGPCRSIVDLDAHGVPIPKGTIHRLDSISKSFSHEH